MIADCVSFRVKTEEFGKRDFGFTRLDTAWKLLDEMNLKVEGVETMQVIPCGDECEVRLRGQ